MMKYIDNSRVITKAMDFLGLFVNALRINYNSDNIECLLLKYRFEVKKYINSKDDMNLREIITDWIEIYQLSKINFLI